MKVYTYMYIYTESRMHVWDINLMDCVGKLLATRDYTALFRPIFRISNK